MSGPVALADVAATLAAFAQGTEAASVGALVPQGDGSEPAIVRFDPADGVLTVAEGEEIRSVPAASAQGGRDLARLRLRRFPDFDVDIEEGVITGAVGALDELARNLAALASSLGDAAMASAEFRTSGGAEPLEIGADTRGGFTVSCGEVGFEVPQGWPAADGR